MVTHSRAADETAIAAMLQPWLDAIGGDLAGYGNHVRRVRELCNVLSAKQGLEVDQDTQLAWTVAGAFHDLGIWSAGTWDYIDPSVKLACDWLDSNDRADLAPLVTRMIREHHGIRARGPADDPVEIFRRADLTDVWLGLRRYGIGISRYRDLLRAHPDAGFHLNLTKLFLRNLRHHPLRPAPMFRW